MKLVSKTANKSNQLHSMLCPGPLASFLSLLLSKWCQKVVVSPMTIFSPLQMSLCFPWRKIWLENRPRVGPSLVLVNNLPWIAACFLFCFLLCFFVRECVSASLFFNSWCRGRSGEKRSFRSLWHFSSLTFFKNHLTFRSPSLDSGGDVDGGGGPDWYSCPLYATINK